MKYPFLPTLLFVSLLSCTREQSESNDNGVPPSTDPIPQFTVSTASFVTTSKLLKREVSFSQTNPHIKNVRMFAYDNNKRCTTIQLGSIDSSAANPVFTLRQTLTFNYDGSAIIPSSFSSVRTVFPNLVTTFYYKYNSQGRKIKDSVRVKNQAGEPADRVINYQYENDKVSATPVLTGFPMENNSYDTLSLLGGGNIEKLVSRFVRASDDQITTYELTYDQRVSPYNKLNIANSLYFESASLGIGYNVPLETHYMGVTTNNMTSWTSGTYTVRFNYAYDPQNYRVKKAAILPGNATPPQTTYFEY